MNLQEILNKLVEGNDLTQKEAQDFIDACASGKATQSQIAGVLTALRQKGEAIDEIAGFIKGMRKHMIRIQNSRLATRAERAEFRIQNLIDTCGTGGDRSNAFNISTTVAFVVAGMGVKVAKHGNRAASSMSGSADVLEKLGVIITLKPEQAEKVLQKTGMVFLFAPQFHPAMKHIGPVRRELGFPTVFNFLGPFLNPARVRRQIIGVPNKKIAEKLAYVAKQLQYEHALIVSSRDNLDEISISDITYCFEIRGKRIRRFTIDPSKFGFKKTKKEDIVGGAPQENAAIIQSILQGEKGPKRDIVRLNAAAAFVVAGKVKTLRQGLKLASISIDSKKALEVLESLKKETQKYA